MTTELSQTQKRLRDAEAQLRTLNPLREQLVTAEQQAKTSADKITQLQQALEAMTAENTALKTRAHEDAQQIRRLEVDLATAWASEAAQAELTHELTQKIQGWLARPQAE